MKPDSGPENLMKPMFAVVAFPLLLVVPIALFSVKYIRENQISKQNDAVFVGTINWAGKDRGIHGNWRWEFIVKDSIGKNIEFSECVDAYFAANLNIGDSIIKAKKGAVARMNNTHVKLFDCSKQH